MRRAHAYFAAGIAALALTPLGALLMARGQNEAILPPPIEAPSLSPEPVPASPVEVDPAEELQQLAEQIRLRREEDLARIHELVDRLTQQVEADRARLARTEEALAGARSLLNEISASDPPSASAEPPAPSPDSLELPPVSEQPPVPDEPTKLESPPMAEPARADVPPASPFELSEDPPTETVFRVEVPPTLDPPIAEPVLSPPSNPDDQIAELLRRIAHLAAEVERLRAERTSRP